MSDTDIDARPGANPDSILDDAVSATFRSLFVGLAPSVGSQPLCLAGSSRVKQFDTQRGDTFASSDPPGASAPPLQEDPGLPALPADPAPEPPGGEDTADLTADPYGPMTWIDTIYGELGQGQNCTAGGRKLPATAPLSIRTMHRANSLAVSARNQHQQVGQAVDLEPSHEDNAFSGELALTLGGTPTTAYLVRIGENESSAYLEMGDAAVILSGTFTKADFPALADELEHPQ